MANSEIQAAKATGTPHQGTTLAAKLVNIFASPGDVFDDVVAEPIRPATWTIPTLMVCFSSLFLLAVSTPPEQISAAVRQLSEAGRLSPGAVTDVTNNWFSISAIMVFISGFVGTIWSALVLWVISRMFLKVAVPFAKALEVVGLAGMILVLGTVVTALLILASGNPLARPALFILANGEHQGSTLRSVLDAFNLFYFWSATVLTIGLNRLTGVSLKECAFWGFGYWVVLRNALILLG